MATAVALDLYKNLQTSITPKLEASGLTKPQVEAIFDAITEGLAAIGSNPDAVSQAEF